MDNSWIGILILFIIAALVFIPMQADAKKNEAVSRAALATQQVEHAPVDNEPSNSSVTFWTIVGVLAGVLFVVYGLPYIH